MKKFDIMLLAKLAVLGVAIWLLWPMMKSIISLAVGLALGFTAFKWVEKKFLS